MYQNTVIVIVAIFLAYWFVRGLIVMDDFLKAWDRRYDDL